MISTEPSFLLTAKSSSKFKERDPFNPKNIVEGIICKSPGPNYGSLFITNINGERTHQMIHAVGKMGYPFDREGNWHFPKAKTIYVFEKLDGTSILAFRYFYKGKTFVSYKTRLRPFLSATSKYGNFIELWNEMLEKYPEIPNLPVINNASIAFELYGTKNKILLDYDTLLDARILFGRFDDGSLVTPDVLDRKGVPHATLIETIDGNTDLIKAYARIKGFLDENIKIKKDEKIERELVEGMEGAVWYVVSDMDVIQFKCKPQYVLDICFANAEGIPKHSIYTTCINAFEDTEHLTFDKIKEMLLEEFPLDLIYKKQEMIKKIMVDVEFHIKLKMEIIEIYKNQGFDTLDFFENKNMIMRYFASKYKKEMSGKIFQILKENFGKKN